MSEETKKKADECKRPRRKRNSNPHEDKIR